MEVFISYRPEDDILMLEQTATAWEICVGRENIKIIEVDDKLHKSEMMRRIAADNLATGQFYILADLGCVPQTTDLVQNISRKLGKDVRPPADLIGLLPSEEIPSGVRICRKGAVSRWVPKRTDSYDQEHVESVLHSHGKVEIWHDMNFALAQEC